jgi:hypothetical protein
MMSSLVICRNEKKPVDLIAALLVEADGRTHQGGDPVEFFLGARLVGDLAFLVLGVAAVDQHRRRDALDAATLGDLGLGRARDLVIGDFLGLLALVARGLAGLALLVGLGAGQFVADGDLAFLAVVRGGLLARLAGAQHASLGVELVERLGDAVVVEFGGKLHARAAGPDHLRDNRFDLLA